ncbi:hypothetical protein [Dyella sp.]|uniref:hypothetical protein n=1 Tax=Dyella sp. TaxID=1869338 RepID=UPI003F7DEDFE
MSLSEHAGPVTLTEVQAVVDQLRELAQRSAENGQQMFHFVFSLGADSLADNLDAASDLDDEG